MGAELSRPHLEDLGLGRDTRPEPGVRVSHGAEMMKGCNLYVHGCASKLTYKPAHGDEHIYI